MKTWMKTAVAAASLAAAFVLGRASVGDGLVSRAKPSGAPVAAFSGGALGADDVREAIAGASDAGQRRAAVEQLVRARVLAQDAEEAGLHRTPEFLRRYSEELARLQIDAAFEKPFQKKLPTEDEVRRFFDENQAKLGRPERVRLAHVALLAPAGDAEARARKRGDAEKALATARRDSRDEYAFGRLAMTVSDDPRSRPAAGELPFLTRDEIAGRLGPEIAEIAFTAEPGRLVERVVETAAGFHIVKVLAREAGREASYDELRGAITARLGAERREKAFEEFMDAVFARASVKIDEKGLEQVAKAPQRAK